MPDTISQYTLRWQMPFEGSWPMAIALAGERVFVGNQLGQIVAWDLTLKPIEHDTAGKDKDPKKVPSLAPLRQLVGHSNGITRLLAAPDGRTLFSASLDHTIRVWDLSAPATGQAELVVDQETRDAQARRAGKKEAPAAPGVTVETQNPIAVLDAHQNWVSALALSRDGKKLISGDFSSQVILWDVATRKELARWRGLAWNWIVALALNADGSRSLVSEHRYKRDDFDVPAAAVRVWDTSTQKETLDVLKAQFPKYDPSASSYEASQTWRKFIAAGLVAADFSPDGKLLALGQGGETDTGKIHLIDTVDGKLIRDVAAHQYGITDVRFSRDGQHVLSTGRDTALRITQVSDGKEVAQLGAPRGGQFKDWLSAFDLSPDGQTIVASDIAGLVHVWTRSE